MPKLHYPITVDGQEYTELKMRNPKVIDMKVASKSAKTEAEMETVMFANLCDVPPNVIDELYMLDYNALQKEYEGFLSPPKKK